jgi:hypothetical protein
MKERLFMEWHLLVFFPFYKIIQKLNLINQAQIQNMERLSSTTLLIANKKIPAICVSNVGLLASQATLSIPLVKNLGLHYLKKNIY